jgi:hypothetical protein
MQSDADEYESSIAFRIYRKLFLPRVNERLSSKGEPPIPDSLYGMYKDATPEELFDRARRAGFDIDELNDDQARYAFAYFYLGFRILADRVRWYDVMIEVFLNALEDQGPEIKRLKQQERGEKSGAVRRERTKERDERIIRRALELLEEDVPANKLATLIAAELQQEAEQRQQGKALSQRSVYTILKANLQKSKQ